MSQDKVSQDKVSQDKVSQDKVSQDKVSQDKVSQDKVSQDKVSLIDSSTKSIFYKRKALCFVVPIVMFALMAKPLVSHSNDSIEVSSTTTGQNIYEVVFKSDNKNTTDNKPGIYAIHRDGSQTSIVLGNVLGVSKGFNGILAQTSQGVTTDTADSLAVVNNRLILFNKNTSSTGARNKKALVLGDGKFSIFDPLLGVPYESNVIINNLNDISIKAIQNVGPRRGLINGGKLFLVSIKQQNSFGNGLTLAFIVENPKSYESLSRIYQNKAMVLGYKFVNEKALEYLVVREGVHWTGLLFSHNVIRATLQKLNVESEDPLINGWIKHMEDFVKKLESEKSLNQHYSAYLEMSAPVFHLFAEQTVYRSIPAKPLMNSNIPLYQTYDPRTSLWSVVQINDVTSSPKSAEDKNSRSNKASDLVFINYDKFDQQSTVALPGRVKYDKKKKYRALPIDLENKDLTRSEYLIVVGDSTVFLLRGKNDKIKTLNVHDVDLFNTRNLEVIHMQYNIRHGSVHYLFLSSISKTGKQSLKVLTLDQGDSGFKIVGNTDLMQKYVSREEILLRSKFSDSSDVLKTGLYFDTAMPVRGAAYYRRNLVGKKQTEDENTESLAKKITPYFFLPTSFASDNRNGKKAFLRAAKLIEVVGESVLTFLQFGNKKVEASSPETTGFYIDYHKGPSVIQPETLILDSPLFLKEFKESRVLGKPLYMDRSSKNFPMALDRVKITPTEGNSKAAISVVPFLPSIRGESSQKKFSVIIVASKASREISGAKTQFETHEVPSDFDSLVGAQIVAKTQFETHEVPSDFDSLVGAQIVKGLRNKKDHFHILFFFGKNNSSTTQGLYLMSWRLEIQKIGTRETYRLSNLHNGTWLHKKSINPSEIQRRLKADAQGNFYWLENPEEPRHSLRLRAYNMSNPEKLIHINHNDPEYGLIQLRFDEKLEDTSGKNSLHSKWEVRYFDLFEKFSWFKKYVDKLTKKVKESSDSLNTRRRSESIHHNDWTKYYKPSNPKFISFLEKLANTIQNDKTPKRQVVLVEERIRQDFLNDLMAQLVHFGKNFTVQMNSKGNFEFYSYDVTSTLEEGQKEMKHIADHALSRPTILYSPIADINSANSLIREKENSMATDKEKKLSRWLFLVTNGQSFDISRIHKKLGNTTAKVPMLLLGTPKEWRTAMEANPDDMQKGVFDQFKINSEFLTSSWMLWAPSSRHATDSVNEFAKTPIIEEERRVFTDLENLFSDAASGNFKGQQKVLLVSEELKPLIHKIIMSKWAVASERSKGAWHHSNEDLTVYQLQGERENNFQTQVFENFQAMRGGSEHTNVVFYSDLERIGQLGRPFNKEGRTYKLKDPLLAASGQNSTLSLANDGDDIVNSDESQEPFNNTYDTYETYEKEEVENPVTKQIQNPSFHAPLSPDESESTILPHLIWLIASEGNKVQPRSTRNWSLKNTIRRQYTTVLLGTEEEWNQIDKDLGNFESKYLDISEHFDIIKLKAPSEEVKFTLIRSLFKRPEIESVDYSFEIPDQNQENAKRQLIYHFVNRVEQIAIQQGIESTTAFIKAFSELRHVLIEDVSLRRSKIINKNFLERLFFKVFPLPISIENLEPDDPLHKVNNSVVEAARQLQRLGYHGSMDLKIRTFDTLLSQTRGSDGGRPIPNSQIYYGGTSSGKTYLFEKTVELLGLTKYDPSKSSNEEADYIIIPVQNLVDNDIEEAGKFTVDKAKELIEDLLFQPKGHRAFILFDDAHKTSSAEVHQRFFAFIQSFFEAPNGVIKVRKRGTNEYKEVPVQNLNLYMTVNPTANKEQREKFAEGNNLNKLVLAALANHNQDMEDSILARWSDIIDLDKFPRGAKIPALVERIRGQSKTSASTVLVNPNAINAIVNKFPTANAREFLIPAASALTYIPQSAERSSLYIVTEREVEKSSLSQNQTRSGTTDTGFLRSDDLNKAVKELTEVDAIRLDEPSSLLKLINFLMSNFRMQVFNHMVLSAQNTNTLKLNVSGQTTIVQKNYITAVMAHLLQNPQLPVSELRISGTEFSYLDQLRLEELVEIQQEQRSNQKPYFPFVIGNQKNFSPFHSLGFMENETLVQSRPRSRQDVFASTVKEIEQIFREMLKLYTRLHHEVSLKDTLIWDKEDRQAWFESLQQEDQIEAYKELSNRLLAVYIRFVRDFYNPDLIEVKQSEQANFTIYDQVRMFTFLIDKSITQLPWGLMSKFILDVMDSAASDLGLGQKPHFINYAYTHQISPFSIQTSDFLNETFVDEVNDTSRLDTDNTNFIKSCSIFLGSGK